MAKNFGTRLPENREGGEPTPQNNTHSRPVADKTRYDWDEHEMSATPDEMAAPEGMPPKRRVNATGRGPNMTRRIAVGVGGLALVGGAIFAMANFGVLDGILKPQEEEAPKEPEPIKLPDKLSPGDYVVGTDLEPGLWVASNFSTNDKSGNYMSVRRGEEEFDLKMPQDRQSATQWAGQAVIVDLMENDEIHTTGSLVTYGVTDMPKRLLSDIPNLRAGLLAIGGDLTAGKWQVTPKKIAEEINLDTYESVYQDVNYYGRITQILAQIAKAQSMTEDDILHTLCGYVTLTEDEVNALHSPYLLADIPYMSDEVEEGDPYETAKVPILDKNGKPVSTANASATEQKPNAQTTETDQNKPQNSETTEQPAQPANPETPEPTETQQQPSEPQPNDPFNAATYHMASETTPNDPFGGGEDAASASDAPAENTEQKPAENSDSSTTPTEDEQKPSTDEQPANDAFNQTPDSQTAEKDQKTTESTSNEKTTSNQTKSNKQTGSLDDPTLTAPQVLAVMLTNANMMTHVIEKTEVELQDNTFVLPLLVDMQTTQKTA